LTAYEGFSLEFLTKPTLQAHSAILEELADVLNHKLLAHALLTALSASTTSANASMNSESRLWLLAYFIYFDHRAHGVLGLNANTPEPNVVRVVSILLSSVADELSSRIELDDTHMYDASESDESNTGHHRPIPLSEFVRSEINSLVNQKSVTGLLAGAYTVTSEGVAKPSLGSEEPEDAGLLASYALTLLRVFPRRADEIRMWLFLGSAARPAPSEGHASSRIPAIKYFWQAARHTDVYMEIRRDPKEALRLLKEGRQVGSNTARTQKIDQDWRVILIFIELYIFILKVMDDEEFFSGSPTYSSTVNQPSSWTRESALPLGEVRDLTIFLKNLAFTMYWNATDLLGISSDMNSAGIGSYFNASAIQKDERSILNLTELGIAGLAGLTIDYVKGIATGLLRMIYERE
jgi:ubiquitin-protein ligase E3 C